MIDLSSLYPLYSKEEIEEQENGVQKLYPIMLILFAFLFILACFYDESDGYQEGKYIEINQLEYSGIVDRKYYSGGRYPHYLILKTTGMELIVDEETYELVQLGDSVRKVSNSDSVYYYTKRNGILIVDLNVFNRKKYHEILNKRQLEKRSD